jgi:hypothetical protein
MLIAERRGEYDNSRAKDALIVTDADTDTRAALFLDEGKNLISIAVDLPNKSGTLCYSVPFDVLVDVLRARLGA